VFSLRRSRARAVVLVVRSVFRGVILLRFLRFCFVFLIAMALGGQTDSTVGPTPGQEYLGLTREQIDFFYRNLDEHSAYANRLLMRVGTIYQELEVEFLREKLDPMAFGARYAEIETMKREYGERSRAIVARHKARLSAGQSERLRNILEASSLDATNYDAACLLLRGMVDYGSLSWCSWQESASPLAAAKPGRRQAEEKRNAFEEFLQLTPEQIAKYRANQNAYTEKSSVSDAATHDDDRAEICSALGSTPLDPMRIGLSMVRFVEPYKQEHLRRRALIAANRAILTGEQLARLAILEQAERLSATVLLAADEGFLRSSSWGLWPWVSFGQHASLLEFSGFGDLDWDHEVGGFFGLWCPG
jgi:hypothetical protein